MGIILKQEDTKRIIFYLKGADTVIKNKVPEVQRGFLLEECESLAREGLRTLCFCQKVLLRAELATDERFSSNARRSQARVELRGIIVEIFAALSAADVLQRLDEAQIANARVNDMQGVWLHPQLQARDRWTEVQTPAGAIPALFPPGVTRADGPRMDAIPALGQHSEAILGELGYDAAQIAGLREAGAI